MMTNPDFDIAPALLALAGRWSTYPTTSVHVHVHATPDGPERVQETVGVVRCCACHEEIQTADHGHQMVVAHLLHSHGYRMDGRRWNGRNELIGHA